MATKYDDDNMTDAMRADIAIAIIEKYGPQDREKFFDRIKAVVERRKKEGN